MSHNFSTSSTRRKEKPSDQPNAAEESSEQKTEEGKDEERPEKSDALFEGEDAVDAKTKVPDPIPSTSGAPTEGKGSAAGSSGGSGGDSGPSGGDGRGRKRKQPTDREKTTPQIPDVYPQLMAIPVAKRPLFPGFYKAITIKDPRVIAAMQEMKKRGQEYIGAFLFKDEAADKDTFDSVDEVYDVGSFCQVTSMLPVQNDPSALTAVLYAHRRIKISDLIPPTNEAATDAFKAEAATPQESTGVQKPKESEAEPSNGDLTASFEESTQETEKAGHQAAASFLKKYNVSVVNVENVVEQPYDKRDTTIRALVSEIVNTFKEIAKMNPQFREQVQAFSMTNGTTNVIEEPVKLADLAASCSKGHDQKEIQEVLQETDVTAKLHKAHEALKKELDEEQTRIRISKDVEKNIGTRQRHYFLTEQMKGIQRELGIASDGKEKLVEKFREKASKLAMPEAVSKVFDEEVNKLAHLEPAASEFNVTRNYLDWLTQIPWGQRSAENFGIKHAMEVLDEDHHGLKDVKDRILEFIAVGKLRGTVEGKILCMVGPPGVGKTSIGKSIARALNRQYYRFSVGGLTDVAEIKGHRRTYVGALPGRIIQALKKCQTENPLVLIDEVDKIGRGHQGDPSSALLELLDPEQNSSFLDHYMDVPVDLSKVLFVCTANMTDTIPRPLLDRMEMIELSGYVADEKMAIAERYLAPQAKELSGLKEVDVQLEKDAIVELINKYCRESGVRNLKKQIEKVYRKSALKIIQDLGEEVFPEEKALTQEGKEAQAEAEKDKTDVKDTPENIEKETTEQPRVALKVPEDVHVSITAENLKDYVGPPVFTADRLYDTTPPGVAMGLAWTQMGGAALYVESILENALSASSRPGFERTGNLKAVMKESTVIAYSFASTLR